MKVFVTSYNAVQQNKSGGVQVRINNYICAASKFLEIDKFNMWEHSIYDCDLLHVFKANIDDYELITKAKALGKKVVISTVIPQEKGWHITYNLLASKLLHIQSGYRIIYQELHLADLLLCQTTQEKLFIQKYYRINPNKIHVIPNGVSVSFDEKNRPIMHEKYGIYEKYVLQVGRFDDNKNQMTVIEALKGLGIKVVFVGGEAPEYEEYYRRCKDMADENFVFLGWLPSNSPELQSAYMNAHIVILPSKKEIFGNSLIEGGAAGALLASTSSLPVSDMGINDYCSIFNPNDPGEIRECISRLMAKDKEDSQSRFFSDRFSWLSVAKQHYHLYKEVLHHD